MRVKQKAKMTSNRNIGNDFHLRKGESNYFPLVLLFITLLIGESVGRNICPVSNPKLTCNCSVKTKGLVLICDKGDIEEVKENMRIFKQYPSTIIQYLTLRQINMPRVPDYIFMGLDIRHLIVSNTNLQVLEDHSITALSTKLEILDLSQNWIHDVPTKAIRELKHTRYLALNHNNISYIGPGAFQGMDMLDRLALYANAINKVDINAFRGLDKLTYVNLGSNHLTQVPIVPLAKLPNLVALELQENRIQTISENDFQGLRNLDTLKLGHNQLTVLGPYVFKNLPRLSVLELDYNKITKIDDNTFSGLEEKLEWLKMGHNSVKEVPTESLKGMHRLREFDFKANNIVELKEDSFEGFGRTIKFLYLQDNRVSTLPLSIFGEMHSLEFISLANNSLRHLLRDVFQPIIEYVQVIDVHGNHLICDCELLWYKQWLSKSSTANHEKVREIVLKTHCWTTSPKHEYSLIKAPIKGCQNSLTNRAGKGAHHFNHTLLLSFILLFISAGAAVSGPD